MQKLLQRLDGFYARGVDLRQRRALDRLVFHHTFRSLHIGLVAAFRANGERILSDRCQQHKFMRNAAAHHAAVALHTDKPLYAAAAENALICRIHAVIISPQILP